MSQYYLMAQLPSLDGLSETMPTPITEERFNELCNRFLNQKMLKILNGLTLTPPRNAADTGNELVDSFNKNEILLRLALGEKRAKKMDKKFDKGEEIFPLNLIQTVETAVQFSDPLSAEQFLNRRRLEFLETLRPADPFCDTSVFYYALKLKLISRLRCFSEQKGREAYKRIYSNIIGSEENIDNEFNN